MKTTQQVLERVEASSQPLPLLEFPKDEIEAVKALIAKGLVGVTSDWKVWPCGKPQPKMEYR